MALSLIIFHLARHTHTHTRTWLWRYALHTLKLHQFMYYQLWFRVFHYCPMTTYVGTWRFFVEKSAQNGNSLGIGPCVSNVYTLYVWQSSQCRWYECGQQTTKSPIQTDTLGNVYIINPGPFDIVLLGRTLWSHSSSKCKCCFYALQCWDMHHWKSTGLSQVVTGCTKKWTCCVCLWLPVTQPGQICNSVLEHNRWVGFKLFFSKTRQMECIHKCACLMIDIFVCNSVNY